MNLTVLKSLIREVIEHVFDESKYSKVMNTMTGQRPKIQTVGLITAENPMGSKLSNSQNQFLNKKLKEFLSTHKISYYRIQGKYGNKENPFLLLNIQKDFLIKLGNVFNQESVIFGTIKNENVPNKFEYEFIQNNNVISKTDKIVRDNNTQNRNDYYSSVKGRKFYIPFFDDVEN